jgi:hypothetical protein
MKCNTTRKRVFSSLLLSAGFVLFPSLALASYQPGQTLDPSCPPSDPTCIVVPSTASSTNVSVKDFGAKGDGVTDDWLAFEAAINAAGPGGHVYVPPSSHNYVISRAVQFLDANNNPVQNLTFEVSDGATIECAGNAAGNYGHWPFFGCIFSGGGGSDGQISADNVLSVLAGTTTIMFSNAGVASNYVVGDIVMVQTSSSFDINPGAPTPTWAQLDRVQTVNGALNTITVLHPIEQAILSAQVLKQTNTGAFIAAAPGGATAVPLYVSYHLTVRGGNWIADKQSAPFDGDGGCVDCTIAPNTVTAGYGVGYGNAFYGTNFSAVSEDLGCEVAELSYDSSDNTINVGSAHFTNQSCNDARYLGIYEGSHDNKINRFVSRICGWFLARVIWQERDIKQFL